MKNICKSIRKEKISRVMDKDIQGKTHEWPINIQKGIQALSLMKTQIKTMRWHFPYTKV